MEQLANLEKRVARLERRLSPALQPRNASLATIRRQFIAELKRDKKIDYLDFAFRFNFPYELVEKVLAKLIEKGAIEEADE